MEENPDATLYYDGSMRYESSSTLLGHSLIKSEVEWDRCCGSLSTFAQVARNAPCPCGSGKNTNIVMAQLTGLNGYRVTMPLRSLPL
jgi:hypothetical protein